MTVDSGGRMTCCLLSSSELLRVENDVAAVLMLEWLDVFEDFDDPSCLNEGICSAGLTALLRERGKFLSYGAVLEALDEGDLVS